MNTGENYLLETIKSLHGLKSTSEKAIDQISPDEMHFQPDSESNSVALLIKHMSGNMLSRFTDFLTTDGEKEWRNRDSEFEDENFTKEELIGLWNKGWDCLFGALTKLKADDLEKVVFIRGEEHTVLRAINRQLVHYAYHAGQIVYLCKQIRSKDFKSLSIPRGESKNYSPK
jgi:hypothetical protein